MSLVVLIVGQATLQPALMPRYGIPAADPLADRVEQAEAVQRRQQAERVAAADEDAFRLQDRGDRVGVAVQAVQFVAGVQAALGQRADVAVVVGEGEGDEQQPSDVAEMAPHGRRQGGDAFRRAEPAAAEQN